MQKVDPIIDKISKELLRTTALTNSGIAKLNLANDDHIEFRADSVIINRFMESKPEEFYINTAWELNECLKDDNIPNICHLSLDELWGTLRKHQESPGVKKLINGFRDLNSFKKTYGNLYDFMDQYLKQKTYK